jgi:beta-glucosidase
VIPKDFTLGFASSSWQIEGSVATRGRSIWDDFADAPGKVKDGVTGEPAADHVRRLEEDLDLLAWLGVDAYRFSISWPRVMPVGRGEVSTEGLDFYDRLVDGLLARGIKPVATLYHWDYPSALHATTPWHNRDSTEVFADYAEVVGRRLGDRVDRWATLNEPWCTAFLGFASGIHAPGETDAGRSLNVAYNLMLAHGRALERMRAIGLKNIGVCPNIIPILAEDSDSEEQARIVDGLQNALWLDLLAGRGIPEHVLEATRQFTDWSFVRDEDLPVISAPIDWIGENYYTVMRVKGGVGSAEGTVGQDASMFPGAGDIHFRPRGELTDMGWEVIPEGFTQALLRIARDLPGVDIMVTENGIATSEVIDDAGVHDPARIDYYDRHLRAVLDAREQGAPVIGYLGWSILDNLEWAEAWRMRFGIVRVDSQTLVRTPKDSALWWKHLLASR